MSDRDAAALDRGNEAMLAEVREGLSRAQKELPPTYFYDARGSRLFEEITRLPEYYLTRAERSLLQEHMPRLARDLRPGTLVELGAGSAEKTRVVLDALREAGAGQVYVPIDVSVSFLEETAVRLRREYPGLRVIPAVADLRGDLHLPRSLPAPTLVAFLGSTIGNFDRQQAIALLQRVRAPMRGADRFLLGVDLRKDSKRLERAYNDTRGVTAEFNRNMLRVLNRELGADFDPEAFEHRAFYEPNRHRIEMHLVSKREQEVTIPRLGVVDFRRGESVRTEISCKYDRSSVGALFAAAGLREEAWYSDPEGVYALALAAPTA
ncbi:MAG: L-histidine N(alpha)-methyltransferase [Gemmatimonadaceae bacterium]